MTFWGRRTVLKNLAGALIFSIVVAILGGVLFLVAAAIARNGSGSFVLPPLSDQCIVYVVILAATLGVAKLYDRMPVGWVGIGLHRWWARELTAGLGFGAGMALLAWLIVLPGIVSGGTGDSLGAFVYWTLMLAAISAGEELLFRGYLYQRGIEIFGPTITTLLFSGGFALAHLDNPAISPFAIVNIFLAGLFFSGCYLKTGSLWMSMGAHVAWNVVHAKVFGLPVSGLRFGGSLMETTGQAPEGISGGYFGPEGGVAATIALIAGGWGLIAIGRIRYSPYLYSQLFRAALRSSRSHDVSRSGLPRDLS